MGAEDETVARDITSREIARRLTEEAKAKRLLGTRLADLSVRDLIDLLPEATAALRWLRHEGLDES
jgi:hypothetical protein